MNVSDYVRLCKYFLPWVDYGMWRGKTSGSLGTDAGAFFCFFPSAFDPHLVKSMAVEPVEGVPEGWNLERMKSETDFEFLHSHTLCAYSFRSKLKSPELQDESRGARWGLVGQGAQSPCSEGLLSF